MKKEYNLLPGPSGFIKKFEKYLSKTPISQRSNEFLNFWFNIKENLKLLVDNIDGDVAILTSSATGAMEASIVSLCQKESNILVISSGKFGDRFFEIANSFSIKAKKLSFLQNRKIDYDLIEKELQKDKYTHITYQICETSSGVFCDPLVIGNLAKKYGCMTIADGVSAFLSDYIYQNEYNIDILIIGSQKGLNSPAGVSFVSMNQRALKLLKERNINSYYFDLSKYLNLPPFTPAINTLYYINAILDEINKIGIIKIIENNRLIALKFRDYCKIYGLNQYPYEPSNAVSVIEFSESDKFVEFCKNKFNLYLGYGQSELKGKVFRVGHFGLTPFKNYDIFFSALKRFMKYL